MARLDATTSRCLTRYQALRVLWRSPQTPSRAPAGPRKDSRRSLASGTRGPPRRALDLSSPWAAKQTRLSTAKAATRKANLDRSYALHRFYADYRDLISWMNDMKAVISADELAKDVAGAEALLERHQEHKGEIDAREDSFAATAEAGQRLLDEEDMRVTDAAYALGYSDPAHFTRAFRRMAGVSPRQYRQDRIAV